MVLGLDHVKSEKLWDILKIENLEYANANHSAKIENLESASANHSAKIENLESASANHSVVLTNHSAVLNQHEEKIQILESYYGKLNFV